MAGAASSRKLISRAGWHAMTDEESRAYLQTRLVLLSKLMFWSFAVLLAGMVLLYWRYPAIEPHDNRTIYKGAFVGLAVLGVMWRGVLLRRTLSVGQLYAIDLFYGAATGASFASAAYIARDLHAA